MYPSVHPSIIHGSQDMEATQMPISEWREKNPICEHILEYYSAIKKNEILPYVMTQIVLEGITLSEISLMEKNTIWFHSYVENKKKLTKWTNQTKTNT